MKKHEKVALMVVVTLFTIMIAYSIWKDDKIDANPAYVLAMVYHTDDTENGQIYSFKYVYDSIEYMGGIKSLHY